jgi:DNA-binding CsgD family transcriptional regulator/PAS domain-containing protein
MPVSDAEVLRLVAGVYDAATDARLWVSFLEDFARVFAADMALLQRHVLSQRRSEILNGTGLPQRFTASYNEHYSRLNVWRNRSHHLYQQGRAVVDQQMCPRSALQKTEFYNDYLLPLGGVYSLAGVIAREGDEALMLTALRSPQRDVFDVIETRAVETLLPHVTRACAVQERLQVLEQGSSVLDSISIGIAMLNAAGKCVYMNRAADEIFRADDGLRMRDGTPHASNPAAATRLRHAIRASSGASITAIEAIRIERPSQRRAYHVLAAPFRRSHPGFAGLGTPGVVLLVTDPEQQPATSAHVLRQLYGLTAREGQLVAQLTKGQTVEEAADALSMRYETARSHLRHIFDKTGARRQTELLLLLRGLPGQPVSGNQ